MSTPTLTAATVAERIRTRFLSESGDLSSLMATEIASSQASGEEHDALALQVRNHLEGFGVLQPFLDDPEIEEVWINGPHSVFVATARSQVFIH
jgi:pilus assembly protein CpaF